MILEYLLTTELGELLLTEAGQTIVVFEETLFKGGGSGNKLPDFFNPRNIEETESLMILALL